MKELSRYQVRIKKDWGKKEKNWEEGFWTIDDMQKLLSSIEDLSIAMGGIDEFNKNLGGVTFSQEKMESGGLGFAHNVILNSSGFSKWTVVHELGHAWDLSNRENLSRDMSISLSAGFRNPILHLLYPENSKYWYDPGNGPPPCGIDTNFNSREDFAESVAAYVYPDKALNNATIRGWPYSDQNRGYSFSSFSETPRGRYIDALIVSRK